MRPSGPTDRAPDTGRSAVTSASFGLALSASAVLLPLLALEAGFSGAAVGLLTALSAASQFGTRLFLPWLLGTVRDRLIMVVAAVLLAVSAGTLVVSVGVVAFVVAQVVQGAARALFWTASQTHVARAPGSITRRIAQLQVASHVGTFVGPALAGLVATVTSVRSALLLTVVGGIVAAGVSTSLVARPPYVRQPRADRGQLWRDPDVALGYWSSSVAGGWRGLLDSYVPVVLALAGLGAGTIGMLAATAEGAAIAAALVMARLAQDGGERLVVGAALAVAFGAGMLPVAASVPLVAGLLLFLAGFGGGVATSVGPAVAHGRAAAGEEGTAIAVAGMYRAGARLVSPTATAGASAAVGVSVALPVVAVGMVLPVLVSARRTGRRAAGRER